MAKDAWQRWQQQQQEQGPTTTITTTLASNYFEYYYYYFFLPPLYFQLVCFLCTTVFVCSFVCTLLYYLAVHKNHHAYSKEISVIHFTLFAMQYFNGIAYFLLSIILSLSLSFVLFCVCFFGEFDVYFKSFLNIFEHF